MTLKLNKARQIQLPYFRLALIVGCAVLCGCASASPNQSSARLSPTTSFAPASKANLLQYVDTRVGTAPSIADVTVTEAEEPLGYVSPIVGNPSALTHWTPQTSVWRKRILTVPVPYWYDQDRLQGFRGTRYPNGAVVTEWGAMSLMPMTGKTEIIAEKRASKFSHDNEIAKPHYYSVYLDDYDIQAEVTGAAKTGFFQFTFPQSDTSSVVFDGIYSAGHFKVIPERNEIEGVLDVAADFKSYFVAQFEKPFASYNLNLKNEKLVGSELVANGFKAEYFNNLTLEGTPTATRTETTIDHDWANAPHPDVKPDQFSARYTGVLQARHTGNHTFDVRSDDGMRLYLDDKLVIDSWYDRSATTDKVNLDLEKGQKVAVRIEYYENWGSAAISFRIAEPLKVDPNLSRQLALKGNEANAVTVSFSTKNNEEVRLKVATSLISFEQARANMREEYEDWAFDKAVKKGADLWEKELAKINVQGDEEDKAIFYTALTKTMVNPRNLNEGGRYFSPFDLKVHEGQMFTDLSLWDTFRSLHPLWVIIKPEETTNVINGMLNAYKEGGWIPKWPNPFYRSIMMGTHADSVIADAYVKGIRGFDTELAFEAMQKNANIKGNRNYAGRVGIEDFNRLGYVPADKHSESVARTLEFAYDDYAIAQMAKALDKNQEFETYMQRSQRYKNVLDKETGLIRGKAANGDWLPPFDQSISVWAQGTEHDSKAYYKNHTLLVPHDIPGLADFMGGNKELENYLDNFFANDYYYVGDEFTMHAPFMYNEVDTPWKTQKLVRDILAKYFFNDPGGLPGNDDCGQVSSWYVFGSMGFYPALPGDPTYQLTSPVFDKVQIDVGNGATFTIVANNNSKENTYIQSATLGGKPYSKNWIHHNAIMAGDTLVLEMGPKPNKNWGL